MYRQNSSYLNVAFGSTNTLVEDALKALKGIDYDTMVGSGTSGLLVVPLLARALDKHFAIVRKPKDASHREVDIEGTIGDRWIFVDDFVNSGATRTRVKDTVSDIQRGARGSCFEFTTEYVGTYEYHFQRFLLEGASIPSIPCACGLCSRLYSI